MKRKELFILAVLTRITLTGHAQQTEVTASWNVQHVILPASQFTPAQTWHAQVMVFNEGRRYSDSDYNHVWGTPPHDAEGHQWYDADYKLTNGTKSWILQNSPFSSDEYYMGKHSYRWTTADVTSDIYLRRSFTLTEPIAASVFLACGHDDAPAEFYINGIRVFTVSDGWNNDERVLLNDEQKTLIKTDGTENVLAVHVHQNWGGAFADCGLYEADMALTTTLLPTLEAGPWPCVYYLLNSNSELSQLNSNLWTGRCFDESHWTVGYGPLSNSPDQFRTTDWGSQVQPLLVRRHFTLTAEQLASIDDKTLTLTCSYDESPKVYLNKTLIWSASGWNDNDYAHYTLTPQQKKLLREGDNVLSVSLQQGNGGGHIDYGLNITEPYVPSSTSPTTHQIQPSYVIYDLMGRKVSLHPKPGLYIVNGKKTVMSDK